jgi:hypothetical protein
LLVGIWGPASGAPQVKGGGAHPLAPASAASADASGGELGVLLPVEGGTV